MKKRIRSRWINDQKGPLFGLNACGFGSDRQGLRAEIEAAEEMLRHKPLRSVNLMLDIAQTDMLPELIDFINWHDGGKEDPIYKLAIVGVSGVRKIWYQWTRHVRWPRHARFFAGHEQAKAWFVSERS